MKKIMDGSIILLTVLWVFHGEPVFAEQPAQEVLQQIELKVTGLKCEKCVPDIRKALHNVAGVRNAQVTAFDTGGSTTIVEVTPKTATAAQVVSALEHAGFTAKLVSVGKPRMVVLKQNSRFWFFGLSE